MKSLKIIAPFILILASTLILNSCSEKSTEPIIPKVYKIVFTISPDGDNSNIYTVDPDGTDLAQLTQVTSIRSADNPIWSPDGQYIYYKDFLDEANDIFRMDADGSNHINLTNSSNLDRLCDISSDGTKMVYISETSQYILDIMIMDLDSNVSTELTNGSLTLTGEARFTPDGQTVYFPIIFPPTTDIMYRNLAETFFHIMSDFGDDFRGFEISPDGEKFAYTIRPSGGEVNEVWVSDILGSNRIKISSDGSFNWPPSWSPDSRKIAYAESFPARNYNIMIVNADGTEPVYLTDSTTNDISPKWSTDGTKIAYIQHQDSVSNLYIMNANGANKTALTNNVQSGYVHEHTWSPGL